MQEYFSTYKRGLPVTYALIGISIFVTLVTSFGSNSLFTIFSFSRFHTGTIDTFGGQFWRLFTPAFIHFDIYHIVFNLLWIWVLGGPIERIQGSKALLWIFAVSSLTGNFSQFYYTGPFFGGMSGVVYALLGYVWMHMRYRSGLYDQVVPRFVITVSLIWFVLCLVGIIPNIANWAHSAGLLAGLVLGKYNATKILRNRTKRYF